MKYVLTILNICLLSVSVRAQIVVPSEPQTPDAPKREIRAVVVGVSKYKELDSRLQLDYADNDAIAFRRVLIKNGVNPENIDLFVNEKATGSSVIVNRLKAHLEASKGKDDLVIFYFSGHGDVQLKYDKPTGFLLLHHVKSAKSTSYSVSDAININDLKYETGEAAQGGRQIMVIIDACRKNKLPSSQENSTVVLEALNEWKSTNIYRLISCKPDQSSIEREELQHGVFTYYLLRGIKGEADQLLASEDGKIEFMEMSAYLVKNVKKATQDTQVPQTAGDDQTFFVMNTIPDLDIVEASAQTKSDKDKGFTLDFDLPNELRIGNYRFRQAIKSGHLMRPKYLPEPEAKKLSVGKKRTIQGHTKNTNAVSFNSTGTRFASVGPDRQIKLWDSETLDLLDTKGYGGGGLSVKFSPNNRYVAAGSWNQELVVWDVFTDEDKRLKGHTNDIRSLAFSGDSQYLVSSGDDHTVFLWDLNNWKEKGRLKGHTQRVFGLGIYDSEHRIISVDQNKAIVWDLRTLKRLGSIASTSTFSSFDMSYDHTKAYLLDVKGLMVQVDLKTLAVTKVGDYHKNSTALKVDVDQKLVFSGGANNHDLNIVGMQDKGIRENVHNNHGIRMIDVDNSRSKILVGHFGGEITLTPAILPTDNHYAAEILDSLGQYPVFEGLKRQFESELVAAIEKKNQRILESYIIGEEILPLQSEVKEALRMQAYAMNLKKSDAWIYKRLNTNHMLLEVFDIISGNDFNRLGVAEQNMIKIIKQDPYEAYTHNTLSSIYRKLEQMAKAKSSAQQAGDKMPNWIEPKISLAQAFLQERAYKASIAAYENALQVDPQSTKCMNMMSDVYLMSGDYKRADQLLKKSVKIDAGVNVLNRQGHLAMARGDFSQAKSYLDRSLAMDSGYYLSHLEMAYWCEKQFYNSKNELSYFNRAAKHYQLAIDQNPSNLQGYIRKAKLFINLLGKNLPESELKRLDVVLDEKKVNPKISGRTILLRKTYALARYLRSKNPNGTETLCIQGFADYLSPEKSKQAYKRFDLALAKNGSDPSVYSYYSDFLKYSGNLKGATSLLVKANKKFPNDPDLIIKLSEAYVKRKKFDQAIELLNDYYSSGAHISLVYYLMARVEAARGARSKFMANGRKAVSNDPDFVYAKEIIKNPATRITKFNEPVIKDQLFFSFSAL